MVCSLPYVGHVVPHHFWGHAVLSTAYLINRTPSQVLDFKTPHDVFGDHVSHVLVSKLPLKFLGVLPMFMSTLINGINLILVFCDVSLLVTLLLRKVTSAIIHLPRRSALLCLSLISNSGERESELESLGLENDVFEDTALRKETTCRTEASDWSSISEDETCGPCEETTDRSLEIDQSPISGDEAGALGVKMTVHTEASD
ncbi:hypothetical protein Prudu_006219 [Prunus dulcis]|uniref:Uncharacterized protein n=1 Tax=Prunus dulcis TaxID=3755 RepID=A0A4Y1QZ73_PRUDU|nr:hypothetical protein Prudu_006219 [Prunus dulcis]